MTMNSEEFESYCREHKLSVEAVAYISLARTSPPSRRVGDSAPHNVCGRLATVMMSVTLQTESRTAEAVFVLEAEHLGDTLEIFDQPPPLQLRRQRPGGKLHISSYTPDYLVLRKSGVYLIECKTREAINKKVLSKPGDWSSINGALRFVPAWESAQRIGISHKLYITEDWAPTYSSNLEFLHAHRLIAMTGEHDGLEKKARNQLIRTPLTVLDLCDRVRGLTSPIVYQWIAHRKFYGALKAQLLTVRDTFVVHATAGEVAVRQNLLLNAFRDETRTLGDSDLSVILKASSTALEKAVKLRTAYQDVLDGTRQPTRNEYRYKRDIDAALEEGRDATAVFLPRYSDRGNRDCRLTGDQLRIMNDVIDRRYRSGESHVLTQVRSHVDTACDLESVDRVSYETIRRHCKRIPAEDIALGQLGRRGHHATRRPVDAKYATLRSAVPGLVAHIDSTQFDARLWKELPFSSVLACPWVYVFFDEGSSRALGSWIGFGKSDRFALALAFRDMAARQHRIPPYIFADRGSEYGSTWWEQLLAERDVSKYVRVAGAPRFGGIEESGLKQINVQLAHRLPGSTWPDQKGRSADGHKKSRETARLAFGIVVDEAKHYLHQVWESVAHGCAESSPEELWDLGVERYGFVGRPIVMDLAFMISTSIPVKVTLGPRKGIRVAHREYWCEELDELRRPFRLDEARLDPGHPSKLYAKFKGRWFVTTSRDHVKCRAMGALGEAFEYAYLAQRAAANDGDRRDAAARLAARIEELEISEAVEIESEPEESETPVPEKATQYVEAEDFDFDFGELGDIPYLEEQSHVA